MQKQEALLQALSCVMMNSSILSLLFVLLCYLLTLHFGVCNFREIVFIPSERETLLKLKHHLSDPSNRLSSWNNATANSNCCHWHGVVCSNVTAHVLELHLNTSLPNVNDYQFDDEGYDEAYEAYQRSRFGGEINPCLVDLKHLSYLDLSYNDFGGTSIPTFLGTMTSLTHLNLSHAGFNGNIPTEIGNLSNLGFNKDKSSTSREAAKYEECSNCGKAHLGACLKGKNVCFACHLPGHISKDYPSKQERVLNPTPPTKGRVFTLSGKEAGRVNNLIQDTCLLNEKPINVLFDSGATHSFISFECVEHQELSVTPLPVMLSVSVPVKENVLTSQVCLNCSLKIQDKYFSINLICLPLVELDVILGMDWLSANQVMINCYKHTIEFPPVLSCVDKGSHRHGVNWFFVSMTFGFVVGFWIVIAPLLISRSWRYAYFHFLDDVWFKLQSLW